MRQFFNITIIVFIPLLIVVNCSENSGKRSSQELSNSINKWPNDQDFEIWTKKVLKNYEDPEIKCNKITGIDRTAIGAIRIMGIWCAENQGIGSPGMNAAVRFIGQAVNSSFRKEFPKFKGKIAISLWDKNGNDSFGSKDWN